MIAKLKRYGSSVIAVLLVASLLLGACAPTTEAPAPKDTEVPATSAPVEVPSTEVAPVAPTDVPSPAPTEAAPATGAEEELPDGTGLRVATIWGSLGNLWNIEGHQSAIDTLKEMGVEVIDSNAGGDRNRQVDLIETAIQQQVDGMLMGDVALEIIDPIIKEAKDAGIPTVTILAYSNEAVNDVSMDEFVVGVQQAHETAKYLGDRPGNMVVVYEPGYRPIDLRHAAWQMAIPFLVPGFKQVASVNAHWPNTMPEAKAQMEAILRQYPAGEIDMVYATFDLEALGVAQAIEEAGRTEITVIAGDGGDVLDWVNRDSPIKATVVMDPKGAGRQAAINLVNHLRGETLQKNTYWPSYICDKDNIAEFIAAVPEIPASALAASQVKMGAASGPLPDGTGLRVATIWGSLGNLWNIDGHQSAIDTLKEMGVEVIDSNAGGDRNRQVDLIETAIQQQVDGMLMGDVALEIIDPIIKEAKDAGIPTVTILAYSNEAVNDVSMDEFLVGIQQAHETAKYLGDRPGNMVVVYEPGYRPIDLRHAAWQAAIPFLVPGFKQVASVNAHWPNTMPEAKAQMEAVLRQYPAGEIDMVYATFDLEALGVAQAIEEAGRTEITVIAGDGGDVLDWVNRDSPIKATVVMDPKGAGRQAAINLVNHLRGETLQKNTYWPSYICDKDNIQDFID